MLSPEGISSLMNHALHCVDENVMTDIGIQMSAMKETCDSCPILGCVHGIDNCSYPDAWPSRELIKTDMGITVMVESTAIGSEGRLAGYLRVYENNIQIGQQLVIITLPTVH